MSEFLIQDTTLEDIADAIRAKKGTSAGIQVSNFPSEIASIPTGSNGAIVHPTFYDTNAGTYTFPLNAYFNIGNNTFAIGFQKYTSSLFRLRLLRVSNGSFTDIGNLCYVTSLASLTSIRNTLQYCVVRTIYNNVEHVYLVFTFKDDQITSGNQKLYCFDYTGSSSSLLVSSIEMPTYGTCLLFSRDGRVNGNSSTIYYYDAEYDQMYRCVIDDNGLGSDWTLLRSGLFDTTPSAANYTMAACNTKNNGILLYRSDTSQIMKWGSAPSSTNGILFTAQSQYQSKKFCALYSVGTTSFNRKVYGFRKVISADGDIYGYMNEIEFNSDHTLSYNFDMGSNFIPSNGNWFLKTHNDYNSPVCLNGYGCVGYFENIVKITNNMLLL